MDSTDKRILRVLQQNAKITTKELAAELNLTVTPTYERIRKLEKEGYIVGYHADLDRNKLGLGLMAFCNVLVIACCPTTSLKDCGRYFRADTTKSSMKSS